MERFASVIGAGSWGTAIAQLLADNGFSVKLWALEDEVVAGINSSHKNPIYLKDATLNEKIVATSSFEEALLGAEFCAVVTPSQFLRSTAEKIKPYAGETLPFVICSKGSEHDTGMLASEVLTDVFGEEGRILVLSGPTHAEEVIKKTPSAATLACSEIGLANKLATSFSNDYFRVYTSTDVSGVELCATFKNVIAIAVGASYGLGFGDNTAAMLITRGVAEMSRMIEACDGKMQTCLGLSGIGDMVVTCMSRHSRNRRFGQDYLSRGKTLEDFKADTKMIVEGAVAARNLQTLEEKFDVDLPITNAIYSMIYEGKSASDIAGSLLNRPLKEEF